MPPDRTRNRLRELTAGEEVPAETLAEAQQIIRENFDADAVIEIHEERCSGDPCVCDPEFIRADEFAPRSRA